MQRLWNVSNKKCTLHNVTFYGKKRVGLLIAFMQNTRKIAKTIFEYLDSDTTA